MVEFRSAQAGQVDIFCLTAYTTPPSTPLFFTAEGNTDMSLNATFVSRRRLQSVRVRKF